MGLHRTWTSNGYEVFTGWDEKHLALFLSIGPIDSPDDTEYIYSNLQRKNPRMTFDEVVTVLKQHNIAYPATLYDDLMVEKAEGKSDIGPDGAIHPKCHDYGRLKCQSKIDVGTIGSRPCEVVLNRILIERKDKKLTNKVMSLHLEFREGLKHMTDIKDVAFRKRMLSMWRKWAMDKLDTLDLPDVVHSHLGCALTANYRDYVRDHGLVPVNHVTKKPPSKKEV
jgi:hypothetical protein